MPKPATAFIVRDDKDNFSVMTVEREEYGSDNKVRFFFYLDESEDAEPVMCLDEDSATLLASVLARYVEPYEIPDDASPINVS